MRKLPSPKQLSNADLWWAIQNVMVNKYGCPKELKRWYEKVKKEFGKRKVKLVPICK